MRILWTLLKIVVGLVVFVPLTILALGLAFGILGALVGLAVMALKLACVGLVGWGVFRLGVGLFGSKPAVKPPKELPAVDPHYEAAMRELELELGERA